MKGNYLYKHNYGSYYHNLTKEKYNVVYLQYKSFHYYNFKIPLLYNYMLIFDDSINIIYCRGLRSRLSWSANSPTAR